VTHSPAAPPRTWIGTPVHTTDGHVLFSNVDPGCELTSLAASNPRATWRFHDAEGRLVFFWEGLLSVLTDPLWSRGGATTRIPHRVPGRAAALITDVMSVVQVMPLEKIVCRVVLPWDGSAARCAQPALAF
jgi:hypothetical protein